MTTQAKKPEQEEEWSMDLERGRGNQYRATRVCVDSYDNGVPVGRFYNPGMAEAAVFHSMSQFLLRWTAWLFQRLSRRPARLRPRRPTATPRRGGRGKPCYAAGRMVQ